MPKDFETEADRIREHNRQLPRKERMANWWDYHRIHVLIGVIVAAVIAFFTFQSLSEVRPDYAVAWVSAVKLTDEQAEAVETDLAQYGEDVNGDGKTVVHLLQYNLNMTDLMANGPSNEEATAHAMSLQADLSVLDSALFLTDDPEGLQTYAELFLYKDGTEPAEGARDLENMVIPWETPVDGSYWLGLRDCRAENLRKNWEPSWRLWQNILAS